MKETTSETVIDRFGYSHWTHKPVTATCEEIALVPQTVYDGWEAYCSCGKWKAFVGGYDPEAATRETTIAALQSAFERHKSLTKTKAVTP